MDKSKRKTYNYGKSFHNKRSRQYSLEVGMTGFLCTCNFQEKKCISDAYKILEEFANEIYGPDGAPTKDGQTKVVEEKRESEEVVEKEDSDGEDISDALNKEIAALKAVSNKPGSAKRFQNVDAGVKNVIFVRTTLPDPLELALPIIKKVAETKKQITRFILRLVPIQTVCKANLPEIKTTADKIFEKYFAQEPKTFSVVFNRHCNDKIQRGEIIEELAGLILKKNPGNKANLSSPEIAVVVEIIRGFCLLSIAPDYFKYKKYNLLELCSVKESEEPKEKTESGNADEDEASEQNNETTTQIDNSKTETLESTEKPESTIPNAENV